jgi:dTMP kinase
MIEALEQIATGGLRPDLTFLFDLPVTEGLRRKRAQGRAQADEWNRIDAEEQAFHERVREGYRALAAIEPTRWVILDATLPPEQLAKQVWQVVRERLAAKH